MRAVRCNSAHHAEQRHAGYDSFPPLFLQSFSREAYAHSLVPFVKNERPPTLPPASLLRGQITIPCSQNKGNPTTKATFGGFSRGGGGAAAHIFDIFFHCNFFFFSNFSDDRNEKNTISIFTTPIYLICCLSIRLYHYKPRVYAVAGFFSLLFSFQFQRGGSRERRQ